MPSKHTLMYTIAKLTRMPKLYLVANVYIALRNYAQAMICQVLHCTLIGVVQACNDYFVYVCTIVLILPTLKVVLWVQACTEMTLSLWLLCKFANL
jgi:hypothetical protein